ncbi:MAG: AhpD family alkylhydroperoxidase, partial [Phenylobacterium sp.]
MTKQLTPIFTIPPDAADNPQVNDIFTQVKQVYGVPETPPLYQSLANSPNVLQGTWCLSTAVMDKGELPTAVKQIIFLAVSSARGCSYCELVYSALCKIDGISGEQIKAAASAHNDL